MGTEELKITLAKGVARVMKEREGMFPMTKVWCKQIKLRDYFFPFAASATSIVLLD